MSTAKLMFLRAFVVVVLIAAFVGMAAAPASASQNDDASCWISASPNTVNEGGSVTLTWGSYNANDGWISDIGDVPTSGSRVISNLQEDTTFTYTVYDDEGSETCETEVDVRDYYTPHTSGKAPGCTIWRENTSGNGVTLRWNTTNATAASLSGVGTVSTFGQYTVYPTYNTTYVLSVYGNGKTNTCQLEVDRGYGFYQPGYQYPQYQYNQPYVYLSQIPYTGIDLGVVGTTVYFLALALFAISGAYLLAYYQGGVLRFSFAHEVKAAMQNHVRTIRNILSK